jgi:hypothetical protein
MFRKASKNVCTSTIVVSPDALSPTSSNSSPMKMPKNTEEDPNGLERADEGDIQTE